MGTSSFFRWIPGLWSITSNPNNQVFTTIYLEILDSAKAPLWLTFELDSSSQESGRVIFKKDDDLRQDILTIQLLKIMDKIWMDKGYDFKMKVKKY